MDFWSMFVSDKGIYAELAVKTHHPRNDIVSGRKHCIVSPLSDCVEF